jgi:hypothetical protein
MIAKRLCPTARVGKIVQQNKTMSRTPKEILKELQALHTDDPVKLPPDKVLLQATKLFAALLVKLAEKADSIASKALIAAYIIAGSTVVLLLLDAAHWKK